MIQILSDNTLKILDLKRKKKQVNQGEPFKPGKRSQTHNPLNHRLRLNQEVQFSINLILISQSKSNKKNN